MAVRYREVKACVIVGDNMRVCDITSYAGSATLPPPGA